ncbi:TPA: ribokinase [Aeromonas salmonicida]|uniref:ribokinase n=1 Tax=Aeromonas salmonicida TaxID=645 RepID=UPI000449A5E0|nr:ribokinase [Aeromonas salmonicida]ASI23425.1 ribokinase [Aeromonas salmonicida]ASI27741.1 ribokinase [Aeromonas salmonicida]ASI31872.1 ribokinase [Aeromonas salmonicida]ATD39034.1 ribokinase [Aeromonas salmonicida subsp. masoucida]ELI6417561.1 ribokinase [Aeromonas salmonicida subsp. salmonicida]
MNRLVVLGSVNADHVLRVPHFPRPGETLTGHSYQVVPGGKGANQAVAAARLGAPVSFIARIGDDAIGQQMRQGFEQDGIDVSAVELDETLPTGIAIIYVSDEGENSIGISAEANGALSPAMVKRHEAMIADAHTLLLQLEVPLESVFEAAKLARSHGTRVVLNPAPARPLPAELLALVDLITPNQTEAELLTGVKVSDEASAAQAAARFHQMGISDVMITLGSQGVYCSNAKQQQLIPGFRVEAVDTTAAGDTFNGALLAAELAGADFNAAVRFAHGAAALSVTKFGAQNSIPSKVEVDAFLLAQTAQGH